MNILKTILESITFILGIVTIASILLYVGYGVYVGVKKIKETL